MARRLRRNHHRTEPHKPSRPNDPDAWTDQNHYPPAQHKYGAKPTWRQIDGCDVLFPSKSEALRYDVLAQLRDEGLIQNLHCSAQHRKGAQLKRELGLRYDFRINNKLLCSYEADFVYQMPDGALIVEDVKGMKLETYNLKKRMMKAFYNIDIYEVDSKHAREKRL